MYDLIATSYTYLAAVEQPVATIFDYEAVCVASRHRRVIRVESLGGWSGR